MPANSVLEAPEETIVETKPKKIYAPKPRPESQRKPDLLEEIFKGHGEFLGHSARADMYRRLGRTAEARASYEKALAQTQQEPERQFLQERIRQLK
jgi:hypothetical protein